MSNGSSLLKKFSFFWICPLLYFFCLWYFSLVTLSFSWIEFFFGCFFFVLKKYFCWNLILIILILALWAAHTWTSPMRMSSAIARCERAVVIFLADATATPRGKDVGHWSALVDVYRDGGLFEPWNPRDGPALHLKSSGRLRFRLLRAQISRSRSTVIQERTGRVGTFERWTTVGWVGLIGLAFSRLFFASRANRKRTISQHFPSVWLKHFLDQLIRSC